MNDTVIQVKDFRKVYGDLVAVDGIEFQVKRGEIFGLLGPNGAGKTTILEVLEGLRSSDGGTLRVMGIDPTREWRKLRNLIGVQLQSSGLPDIMRVDEALRFFSAYHGLGPQYDLLERLGLSEKMDAQYRMLSTGLQRRLSLALALAHNPPVVFLDEPTAGLDVPSRNELHTVMNELRTSGTTIILATHDMAEAEKMTDRVAILHSRLSAGERFDTWRRARQGDFDVVIGPRSALFASPVSPQTRLRAWKKYCLILRTGVSKD